MPTSTPKYFKAWIIFFLIATVGGLFLGALTGGFIGLLMGLAHMEIGLVKLVCGAAGFIIGVPVSYFTFRWVVGEFIVKDLRAAAAPPPAEPPPV